MCVCECVCVYVCVYALHKHNLRNAFVFGGGYVCTYKYIYINRHSRIHVQICIYMRASVMWMYVPICMHVYARVCAHTHACTGESVSVRAPLRV